ncbi:hypothetical protein CHS0354_019227 [Potamilus streckersoni]|uniref:Uncharacterized protein n=1 Tax=Potamilus streckersoni TaxID=2493646 RepID=A0AAE0SZD2_9BIVA|nr:hypothetical protein CHS0354_019227 [Potamilus streckersoni]
MRMEGQIEAGTFDRRIWMRMEGPIEAGSEDGGLHVISFTTGSWIQELSGHQGKIQRVKICSDCHHAIVACSSGLVYLFNFRTTKLMTTYRGHHSDVNSLSLSDDERLIFSASKEEVIVWSLIKRCAADLQMDYHSGPISCLAITKDNKQVISGSVDGLLKTWNLDVGDFADNLIGHVGPITCVAVAPDNTFIVSGSRDKTLRVWNLILAKAINIYRNHEYELSNVYVLSDSKLVLSIDKNQTLHVWRADDAQSIQVYSTAFHIHTVSPDSRYIISGVGDKSVRIWKLLHGLDVKVVTHSEKITFITCTQDSKYLVTGSEDKSLKIWELETGKLTQVLVEHGLTVRCITVTSDNVNVISGGDDSMIIVWNFYLGSLDRKLVGHNQSVSNLRLTSDESILISASMDNTIRAWDYTRGNQIALFNMHGVILDFVMTNTAHRIIVQLANINKLATLCLHNTPATEKDKLNGNVHLLKTCDDIDDNTSEKSPTLPIKPKPLMVHRVSAIYPLPSRRRRYSSESSSPEIIQHSPIRASIQSTLRAHEKSKTKTKMDGTRREYRAAGTLKSSGLCNIL